MDAGDLNNHSLHSTTLVSTNDYDLVGYGTPTYYVRRNPNMKTYGYAITVKTSFNGGLVKVGETYYSINGSQGTVVKNLSRGNHTLLVTNKQFDGTNWWGYQNWMDDNTHQIISSYPDTTAIASTTNSSNGFGGVFKANYIKLVPPIIDHFTQNPDPLYNGGTGYVYAHLSQGIGNETYTWTEQHYPAMTISLTPLGDHCQIQYFVPYYTNFQIFIFCTATNAYGSDLKTYLFNGYIVPYYSSASLAFETNGVIADENPVLVSSIDNPGVDVTDYYLINEKIIPENEKINLLLHEAKESKGNTNLDQVELWKVKAGPNDFVAVTDEGEIVSYKKPDKPNQIILNDTLGITSELANRDTNKLIVKKGDRIKVLQPGNSIYGVSELYSVFCAQASLKDNAKLLTENKSTNNLDKYHFRPGPSTVCKKINTAKNGSIDIKFTEDLLIDYFALVKNENTAKLEKLKLLDAVNNEKSDVGELLAGIDASYSEINPGEKVSFTFASENNPDENAAYILKTVGRYEENKPKLSMSKNQSETEIEATDETENTDMNPTETKLLGNYPNPFNPTTNISYMLKENSFVELTVINTLGQQVKKLVSEYQAAGNHTIPFNGSNLASGIYFYRIQAGDKVFIKKMMLLK